MGSSGHPRLLPFLTTIVATAAACTGGQEAASPTPSPRPLAAASTTTTSSALPPPGGPIIEEPVAIGLDHPAAFALTPSGEIFYGERLTGEIRRLDPDTQENRSFYSIPDVADDLSAERGIVGLVLDPQYPDVPIVYVYVTRSVDGRLRNEIWAIRDGGQRGRDAGIVLGDVPAADQHNGGKMAFGPDGSLYVAIGDNHEAATAQEADGLNGRILRISLDRSSRAREVVTFASGIRNAWGLAFDPWTGALWETENGPECNDEVNRVEVGANLGWGPSGDCGDPPAVSDTNTDGASPDLPEFVFSSPALGITGIAFCDGCGLGPARDGHAFVGSFNTGEVHELMLNADRAEVVKHRVALHHGRLVLSIEVGPDGTIYFSDGIGIYRMTLGAG